MKYNQSRQTAKTNIKGEAEHMECSNKELFILSQKMNYSLFILNRPSIYMVEYLVYRENKHSIIACCNSQKLIKDVT